MRLGVGYRTWAHELLPSTAYPPAERTLISRDTYSHLFILTNINKRLDVVTKCA